MKITWRMIRIGLVLVVSQFCAVIPAFASDADDEYLRLLSEEINRPEYLESIRKEKKILVSKESEGFSTGAISNTIMLEHALEKHAPAAFKQFRNFSFVKKSRVFHSMQEKDSKLSVALEEILEIARSN